MSTRELNYSTYPTSYVVMFWACICIILLVATGDHSRNKLEDISHGRLFIKNKNIPVENVAVPTEDIATTDDVDTTDDLQQIVSSIPITGGGMTNAERIFLGNEYTKDTKVFEWGMGKSSVLANMLHVKKLVSVDNAAKWVNITMQNIDNERYVFQYVDIGKIAMWGTPIEGRSEKWLNYSRKVYDEEEPFDVYLVDGRFRIACACAALLHAKETSIIFIHDFERGYYQRILEVTDKIEQVGKLVKLKVKNGIARQNIENLWEKYKYDWK